MSDQYPCQTIDLGPNYTGKSQFRVVYSAKEISEAGRLAMSGLESTISPSNIL